MARMPSQLPQGTRIARQGGIRMPADTGLAQGLNAVADAAQAIEQRRQRERDDSDRLKVAEEATRLRSQETERLITDADATPDDALDGFEDRFVERFDLSVAERAKALPKRMRDAFQAEAVAAREQLRLRAIDLGRGRREIVDTRALDEQTLAAQQTVFQDPTQHDAALKSSLDALAASRLPEGAKAARAAKIANAMATTRIVGLMQSAPEAAKAELESDRWRTVLTPAQMLELGQDVEKAIAARNAEAAALLQPRADALINAVLSKPEAFAGELAAFRAAPELARLSDEARGVAVRKVAGRAAEARLVALGQQNPWAAKAELVSGQHDAYLDPDDKQRLLVQLTGEVDQRNARARAEAEERARLDRALRGVDLETAMEDDLASRAATGKPGAVSLQEVAEVFGPVKAKEYRIAQERASALYDALGPVQGLPSGEIRRRVGEAAPKPGEAGFDEKMKRHRALIEAADRELKLREDDPAGAALRNATVRALWENYAEDPSPAKREAYVRATMSWQATLGVPSGQRTVLPANVAQGYAARIAGADPATRPQVLKQVTDELAGWGASRGLAMAQVARAAKDDTVGVLAALAARPEVQTRFAALLAQPDPGATVSAGDRKTIARTIDDQLRPYARTWAALPGGTAHAERIRDAAVKAALVETAAGQSPGSAARAAAAAFAEPYVFRDGLRLPKTWNGRPVDPAKVQRGAALWLNDLLDMRGIDMPAGDPRLDGAAAAEATAQAVRMDGRWITNADDTGLVLVDTRLGRAIARKDGQPVQFTWEELQQAGEQVGERLRPRTLLGVPAAPLLGYEIAPGTEATPDGR